MKYILTALIFTFTSSLYAGPGLGTGGIGMTTMKSAVNHSEFHNLLSERELYKINSLPTQSADSPTQPEVITFPINKIEAITTLSGDYARIDDIAEGFVNFSGVSIQGEKIYIQLKNSHSEVDSLIFNDAEVFQVKLRK